jgi:hypothetical protein
MSIETVIEMDQVNVRALDQIMAYLIDKVRMGECSQAVGIEVVRIIQKAAEYRLQLSQDVTA